MAAPVQLSSSHVAVGVDVASAARLAALLERRPGFAERVFSERERAQCQGRPDRLAARWAAKEAVRKLYGGSSYAPLPSWRDIEVLRRDNGAPELFVHGFRQPQIAVSLSHEGDLAVAIAVNAGTVLAPGSGPLDLPLAAALPPRLRLPERPDDGHKGSFGSVAVLAGSHGFSGAAYLAAMGAARGGAGRVRLCVPASLHPAMAVKCTEVMPHPLPDSGHGIVGEAAVAVLRRDHLPACDVLVAGPGLGTAAGTAAALAGLLESLPVPAVVDADGLSIAAARGVDWGRSGQPVVLTPHPAEMGRLVGASAAAVQQRRREIAAGYARERAAVVVLKGAQTVVAAPDGRVHVDSHRLVVLATGGTGDVLAGLCGAMLAGGLPAFEAAVAAVSIHAEAGAALQAARGRAGALAGDLLEALPAAQERLRRALERGAGRTAVPI